MIKRMQLYTGDLIMSNTYNHKIMGKYKRIRNEDFYAGWEYLKANHPYYGGGYWDSTPSWWNNLHHTRPARRETSNMLAQIDLNNCEEYWDFPNYKKPHIYYW